MINDMTLKSIPNEWLPLVVSHFQVFPNDTENFHQPILRESLRDIYPLYVVLYILLIIVGLIANVVASANLLKKQLHRNAVCVFLLNVMFCNLIMSILVLPLSLVSLLIQNWVFGKLLCYCIPMLQDVPIHASMASLVLVSIERFREIVMPRKPKIVPWVGILAIWILSICVVMPYAIYIRYLDMEAYLGPQFKGVGLCAVNLIDDIAEYIRGLFIALYALPLALIAYLHIRISNEISTKETPSNAMALGCPSSVDSKFFNRRSRSPNSDVWNVNDRHAPGPSGLLLTSSLDETENDRSSIECNSPSPHLYEEVEFKKEWRDQRYVGAIVLVYALCLCPLMILRLVKNVVLETNTNSAHFDLTFITFVWVAFLPTVTTPIIFSLWNNTRQDQDYLQGYFRFSFKSTNRPQYPQPPVTPKETRSTNRPQYPQPPVTPKETRPTNRPQYPQPPVTPKETRPTNLNFYPTESFPEPLVVPFRGNRICDHRQSFDSSFLMQKTDHPVTMHRPLTPNPPFHRNLAMNSRKGFI